jgi:hypothetical protein
MTKGSCVWVMPDDFCTDSRIDPYRHSEAHDNDIHYVVGNLARGQGIGALPAGITEERAGGHRQKCPRSWSPARIYNR